LCRFTSYKTRSLSSPTHVFPHTLAEASGNVSSPTRGKHTLLPKSTAPTPINAHRNNKKLFHRAHYNIIAARIKPLYDGAISARSLSGTRYLEKLAWDLAARFAIDNDEFDPTLFFTNCGMDTNELLARYNDKD